MTPIKPGTAQRLGLRKPSGFYRYKDGTTRWLDAWLDEVLPWVEEQLGVKMEPFQRLWLNGTVRAEKAER